MDGGKVDDSANFGQLIPGSTIASVAYASSHIAEGIHLKGHQTFDWTALPPRVAIISPEEDTGEVPHIPFSLPRRSTTAPRGLPQPWMAWNAPGWGRLGHFPLTRPHRASPS
jgi:hypothetical protein